MGNSKSTSCSNKTSVTEEDLRLTDYDMTIYETRKEKIFKGTLAVCIVYAGLALLLLVGSYLFPSLKYVVFESFLPFTIVFIIGTILLIAYLFYSVLNYKPVKINKNFDYTNISCPDYWTLEYNEDYSKFMDSNVVNPSLFNYRCVLNSNIFSKYDIYANNKMTGINNVGISSYGSSGTYDTPSTSLMSSDRDSIDTNKGQYYFADIKNYKNKDKIAKIAGGYDSNIYGAIVSSALLMNNYIIDTTSSTENSDNVKLKNLTNANEVDSDKKTEYTTGTAKDEYNIHPVKINNVEPTDIYVKKITRLNNSDFLDNITTDGSTAALAKIPLVCNRVYPLLLAAQDKGISKATAGRYDENIIRCAYSKLCGVPWSDMNCDKYPDVS